MIRLENITVRFDRFTALDDISVQVNEGEFFTFLGPSGCGKTTTLRVIAGFIQPAAGRVMVRGRDITGVPIEERNIGIVFQSYALFPTMTVRDNIAFGLKIKKLPAAQIRDRVADIASKVDLSSDQLGKAVSQLSGGQQQRVAIARALALDPMILCFDEPTSALDPLLTKDVLTVIRDLARDNNTMIVVTHEMAFAREVADRVMYMEDGRIVTQGTPQEVFADEAVRTFTAG